MFELTKIKNFEFLKIVQNQFDIENISFVND
jgi:hypothetical protein